MFLFPGLVLLFKSLFDFALEIVQIYWILLKNLIIFSSHLLELLLNSVNLSLELVYEKAPVFFSTLSFILELLLFLIES